MNQSVLSFGPADSLTGVFSQPERASDCSEQPPIAIILNAGVVHRSGPFRLHVDIANKLSDLGYACLRLDLSGLGDSVVRTDVAQDQNRAALDVADAMDALEQETGNKRFVLLGLCSGAYNAHQIALEDDRVVGCVFMDGLVYRTRRHYLRTAIHRATSPRYMRNALRRRLLADEIGQTDPTVPTAAEFFEVDKSERCVASEIETMLQSGKQLLFTFTQGCAEISSRSQFREMYGLDPGNASLQVEYFDNFEHTFPIVAQRNTIVNRVGQWFSDRFSIAGQHCLPT
ncbi:MAG: alpha/beta hydrolase [Aureliella sp.]